MAKRTSMDNMAVQLEDIAKDITGTPIAKGGYAWDIIDNAVTTIANAVGAVIPSKKYNTKKERVAALVTAIADADVSGGGDDSYLASIIDRSVKDIVVPDGVTEIGYGAFAGCEHAESVSIPDSVIGIHNLAFSGLGTSTGKTLDFVANSVESVASTQTLTPFGGAKIKRLILPSIKTIQGYAFGGCAKLEYIYLGPNCTNIGDNAFAGVPITCKVECGFADSAISGFPANAGFAGDITKLDITYNVSAPTI